MSSFGLIGKNIELSHISLAVSILSIIFSVSFCTSLFLFANHLTFAFCFWPVFRNSIFQAAHRHSLFYMLQFVLQYLSFWLQNLILPLEIFDPTLASFLHMLDHLVLQLKGNKIKLGPY